MARYKYREIVIMALAVAGACVILFLIGASLVHVTTSRGAAGSAGIAAVAGGVSVPLFTILILAVIAIVFALAIFLRNKR